MGGESYTHIHTCTYTHTLTHICTHSHTHSHTHTPFMKHLIPGSGEENVRHSRCHPPASSDQSKSTTASGTAYRAYNAHASADLTSYGFLAFWACGGTSFDSVQQLLLLLRLLSPESLKPSTCATDLRQILRVSSAVSPVGDTGV